VDIKFNCTACGTHIAIDEAGAGLSVQCPTCGASLIVPENYSVCARGLLPEALREGETVTPQGITKKFVMHSKNWIPDCPQNIYEQIQRSLLEGDKKGEPMRELTKRVQKEFRGVDKDRAYAIAHTEMVAAYGAAQFQVLKDSNYKTKRWVTARDELVRPSHRDCELQGAIPIDEPFSNGLMYPCDLGAGNTNEVKGCRCLLQSGDPIDEATETED
jgi:SPP1 gp7 family putative phage head morphogenesis protein